MCIRDSLQRVQPVLERLPLLPEARAHPGELLPPDEAVRPVEAEGFERPRTPGELVLQLQRLRPLPAEAGFRFAGGQQPFGAGKPVAGAQDVYKRQR